jgi:hypothetical protein
MREEYSWPIFVCNYNLFEIYLQEIKLKSKLIVDHKKQQKI